MRIRRKIRPIDWLLSALEAVKQAHGAPLGDEWSTNMMIPGPDGRTRKTKLTFNQVIVHFWSKVSRPGDGDQCWEWQDRRSAWGYGAMYLRGYIEAHRFAFVLANKIDPGPLLVCHTCDNPPCCNPAHLFLGTNMDNAIDCVSKGRRPPPPSGEQHRSAKLTITQVREIRDFFDANGKPKGCMTELARKYKVSLRPIQQIFDRKGWREVTALKDVA